MNTTSSLQDLHQAELALAGGHLVQAAALFVSALSQQPGCVDAHVGLARLALFDGDVEVARTHADRASALDPDSGPGWTVKGLIHEVVKGLPGALPLFERGARLGEARFLCQFNYGCALARAGDAGRGVVFIRKATELEPGNPHGFIALGSALKQLGQDERALEALEWASAVSPRRVEGWASLADALVELGRQRPALDALERGLSWLGEHPALLRRATGCALALEEPRLAANYVERHLGVQPDLEVGWLLLAQLTLMAGDLAASEAAARRLLELDPRSWEGLFHLAVLAEAAAACSAEQAWRTALAGAPPEERWKALMNLALELLRGSETSDLEEARDLLLEATETAPATDWRARFNLALAWARLGERPRALELAGELVANAPAAEPLVAQARLLTASLAAS